MQQQRAAGRALGAVLWVALGAVVLRMLYVVAWQCDDAYITHRTAWNLVHGEGLTWNPSERVQAFTHPLWMLVSAAMHLLSGEVFFSLSFLSIGLALLVLVGVARGAGQPLVGWVLAVLLSATAAFVDWSVSGLENPLLHLLLLGAPALALAPVGHRRLAGLGLLTSALYLTRPDAPVFVAPLVVHAWWTTPGRLRGALAGLLGGLPLLLWEGFSLVWFGSLVPNTAVAKLNLEIPAGDLAAQGLAYLADAAVRDPLALLLALGGATVALVRGPAGLRALGVGLLLYLAYVVRIGGDFMALRFIAAPAVLGVALAARSLPPLPDRAVAGLAVVAVVAGLASPASRWRDDGAYGAGFTREQLVSAAGISDERAFHGPTVQLHRNLERFAELRDRDLPVPPHPRALEGARARASARAGGPAVHRLGQVGFFAYFAGPEIHVVDIWALADPFIARIPFRPEAGWRVGHYERDVPDAYLESVAAGTAAMGDPALDAAFRDVQLVVSGPLFSAERWRAIWDLQRGVHDAAFATLASGSDVTERSGVVAPPSGASAP